MDLECSVCLERYSDDKRPRGLPCGHVLCTPCLAQILQNSRVCPECRGNVNNATAEDYAVVFPLLNLARGASPRHTPRAGWASNPSPNAGQCPSHGSPRFFYCMTCKSWVCRDCVVVDHREPPKGSCTILAYKDAVDSMKTTEMQDKTRMLQSLEQVCEGLDGTLKETTSEIWQIEQLLQATKEKERQLGVKLQKATQLKEGLREATQRLAKTCTNEGVSEAVQDIEKLMDDFPYAQALAVLLDAGVEIYTTQTLGQQERFARLTKGQDNLRVGALCDGSPPSSGIVLQFEDLRRLVPRESPVVYMDVGWSDQHRGTVYIQLYGDTPRARQTALLCSGEKGPSYSGTCIYRYDKFSDKKYEYILGGDYESNDGTGGRAIVEGITDGGEYKRPFKAGLFCGLRQSAVNRLGNFLIYLKDTPGCVNNRSHGQVKSGLDILLEASKLTQVKDATVTDCGLVIPLG